MEHNKSVYFLVAMHEFQCKAVHVCLFVQGKYVAAFAQSNLGDVSPNTKGPHCIDSGLPCDILTSTCHGKVRLSFLAAGSVMFLFFLLLFCFVSLFLFWLVCFFALFSICFFGFVCLVVLVKRHYLCITSLLPRHSDVQQTNVSFFLRCPKWYKR